MFQLKNQNLQVSVSGLTKTISKINVCPPISFESGGIENFVKMKKYLPN